METVHLQVRRMWQKTNMKIISKDKVEKTDMSGKTRADFWPELTEAVIKLQVNEAIEMDVSEWKYLIPATSNFFNSRAAFIPKKFNVRHSRDRKTLFIIRKS